ncbi:MAG: PilZ domain-containing protein [Candidatus Polarisedimenticolia bacterium]
MKEDKRRHPRVARKIRVRSTGREAVELETIDLSAGGFSCTAPAFLAPMTKLAVSLVLPAHEQAPEQSVEGEAVVVRTQPDTPGRGNGEYQVAVFFSRMDEDDRRTLQRFLAAGAGKPGH